MTNIVIVGGSFSAVGTAHRIFQKAAKTPSMPPFKITLVSRDSHFYWNLAATRATVQGKISDDEIFHSIAGGFAHYGERFEFVLGSAAGVDTETKTLQVTTTNGSNEETIISYDILILATGTHTKADSPYKSRGSTEVTKDALHQLQARVKAAKTIVIAGAGPTGVELAGELADGYGASKNIVLVRISILNVPKAVLVSD
jgi:NADH dehydrogenase FAD-containing subunit